MAEIFFDLDKRGPAPMYRQIAETIIQGVRSGTLGSGSWLPSSRELADELDVSRNTVNLAYQELMAQGYIASQERRGMFITPELVRECSGGGALGQGARPGAGEASVTPVQAAPRGSDEDRPRPGSAGTGQGRGDRAPLVAAPGRISWSARLRERADAAVPDLDKPADWHEARYPFIVGQIENRNFPVRAWQRCLREATYHPNLRHSFMDSSGKDDEFLVEMIRTRLLPSRGVEAAPDEIMMTLGTQHGLHLVSDALLGTGSRALLEDPGYLDARHILMRGGARVLPLPVDGDGAVVPDSLRGIDLTVLTPSHHCPTNATLSRDRRTALLGLAREYGAVIVEDDHDAEFRYRGRPSPSLKALDTTGHVVHLGSFSKFLAPGLRLGFLVGPAELVSYLRREVRYTVRHVPGHLQRAMALFLHSGDYHRVLRLHRDRMRRKWRQMTEAATELLPFPTGQFPPGGLSLWFQGPSELDVARLAVEARARGVLLEPGEAFFAAPNKESAEGAESVHVPAATFRLGYGAIPMQRIRPGMEALRGAALSVLS